MDAPIGPQREPVSVTAHITSEPLPEGALSQMVNTAAQAAVAAAGLGEGTGFEITISDEMVPEPTSLQVDMEPLANNDFAIYRTPNSDLILEEKGLNKSTVEKVKKAFGELSLLIVEDIQSQDTTLRAYTVENIKIQVDTGRQTATYWVGNGPKKTIDLTKDRVKYTDYHKHMNEINKLLGAETMRSKDDLEQFYEGVSGYSSLPSALSTIDVGNARKHAEMEKYAKDLLCEVYPTDFGGAQQAMCRVSAGETYREAIKRFLEQQQKSLTDAIDAKKNAGENPLPQDVKTLKQVKEQLALFENVDMFAVNTVLADKDPQVTTDFSGAKALSKKFEEALTTVAKIHKGWLQDIQPLTPEQKRYCATAGALALPAGDQLLYQKYCGIATLDYRKPLPEQIIIAWARAAPDLDNISLFSHIEDPAFKAGLKTALEKANGLAASRKAEIGKINFVGADSMKGAVAGALTAHKTATYTAPPPAQPAAAQTPPAQLPANNVPGVEDEGADYL